MVHQLLLSVVICSHNPRDDFFAKVLTALEKQTLNYEYWECILIDNASDTPLALKNNLSWHPYSRCLQEKQLGLTFARLRSIQEAQTNLLVFVDDDNILDSDYLENVIQISENFPFLGAWGGQTIAGFEEVPPEWTRPFWSMLAIWEFEQDVWSNLVNQYSTTPCGAGMCIRKTVADKYAELVKCDVRRQSMGRQGKKLTSFEDSDMAFTACDMGLGTGRFTRLKLTHLMPKERIEEGYLLRLLEASTYSRCIVESYRSKLPQFKKTRLIKLADFIRFWRMSPRERRFHQAYQRGLQAAEQELALTV